METIRVEQILAGSNVITDAGRPVRSTASVAGRLLGEVTAEELIAASYGVRTGGEVIQDEVYGADLSLLSRVQAIRVPDTEDEEE